MSGTQGPRPQPVGQSALRAAQILGAASVIAIDRVSERLRLAERQGAHVLDYHEVKVQDIDAVGLEAHGTGPEIFGDKEQECIVVLRP